jgi:hypothetical protein
VSFDEITTINYQNQINVHVFITKGWKWIPILPTLQQVVNGFFGDNLMNLIVDVLL